MKAIHNTFIMDKTTAKKAADLLTEIDELSEYKKILENRGYGNATHFEFRQHYR
jgi:hypothetical protein